MKLLHPRKVFKYELDPIPNIYAEWLPRGSEWLSVEIDPASNRPVIYALVASPQEYGEDEPMVGVQYEVIWTGEVADGYQRCPT